MLEAAEPGGALADDEIDLAHQLLTGLDLRATGFTLELAELARDTGRVPAADFDARAEVLRTRMRVAGLAATQEPTLGLVVCFHQAAAGEYAAAADTINRLRGLTSGGDYAYYVDLAYFMVDRALDHHTRTCWIDGEPVTRQRWHDLVTNRGAGRSGRSVLCVSCPKCRARPRDAAGSGVVTGGCSAARSSLGARLCRRALRRRRPRR